MDGVRSAVAHGPDFAPGTAFGYSNTNYVLLAMIVEQVTGNSFSSELTRRIIKPLRLQDTTFPTDSVIRGRHVHGYFFLPEPFDVTAWNPALYGAVGRLALKRPRCGPLLPRPAAGPPNASRPAFRDEDDRPGGGGRRP